jgi:CDP-glucose 4,6-dehydratase
MEPLRGYIMLAQRLLAGQKEFATAWNFGPGEEDARPVEWIVRNLAERWSPNAVWQLDKGPHPHEATFLKLDCARAHNLLGWKPALRLSDALELIVDWFKAWNSGADMHQVTLQQIQAYQRLFVAETSQVAAPPVVPE